MATSSSLFNFFPQQGGLSGNALLGTILLGGSALGRQEPGHVTEARQRLRNLTSPEGFGSVFGQTVGGLEGQFAPRLQQLEEAQAQGLAQRVKAAFPARAGLQGPEIGSLLRQARDEFLPQRQAFLGQLGLQGIGTQASASQQIMALDRPDPFKEALAGLGGSLIAADVLRGGQQGGMGSLTGNPQLDQLIRNSMGGGGGGFPGQGGGGGTFGQSIGNLLQLSGTNAPGGTFPSGIEQSLSPQMAQQLVSGLQAAFPQGTFSAGFGGLEPIGNGMYAVTKTSGEMVGVFNPSTGVVTNSATGASANLSQGGFWAPQAAGTTGFQGMTSGTGLMGQPGFGSAGGLASGLGSAFVGYQTGSALAPTMTEFANRDDALKWLNPAAAGLESLGVSDQGLGAFTGAQSGAVTGFLIGGPVGAAIGAVTGAVGGFNKVRKAEHEFKALSLASDQKSQGQTTGSIGSFWTEALGAAGFQDLNGWNNLVQQTARDVNDPAKDYSFAGVSVHADQPDNIAAIGSKILLKQLQDGASAQGLPPPASLDQVPGFRDKYIEFILGNTFIEEGGGVTKTKSIGQKGSLLTSAGL